VSQLFDYAMDIGEQMLISGAEVHRVEESINRMCYALGAKRVDVFIITSSMVVMVYTQDDTAYTRTRRVTSMKFNIERLHKLNALSRQICEKDMTEEEIQLKLNEAINCKPFPALLEFISSAVIAGAFTLFFGGNISEKIKIVQQSVFYGWIGLFPVKAVDTAKYSNKKQSTNQFLQMLKEAQYDEGGNY